MKNEKRYEVMTLTYHWYTVILIERLVWYCLWIQCRYARWIYACSRSSWELIDRYVVQWCRLRWRIIDSSICCNHRLFKMILLIIKYWMNMVKKKKKSIKCLPVSLWPVQCSIFCPLRQRTLPICQKKQNENMNMNWIVERRTSVWTIWQMPTSACKRCASCSVSNVTNPYPLLTPARSTMIFVDFTFPYDEKTRHSSASVVSPLQKSMDF